MTDLSKIRPAHTQRTAYVYIRQSTPGQVEHNRESTARQYALANWAGPKSMWSSSTKIWGYLAPAPISAPDLLALQVKSRWLMLASYSDWKYLV